MMKSSRAHVIQFRGPFRGESPRKAPDATPDSYDRFALLDGSHDLKKVPNSCKEYQARTRRGGHVAYLNFNLAKEMGLINKSHPHSLTQGLNDTLLHTFSIVIINEYDLQKKTRFHKKDIRPNTFMATRYLQLQHPDKTGGTSGDGRSIWNGRIRHQGKTWDVSSCGTGATSLSPAVAIEKRFFKTGDPRVAYGCGRADLYDGFSSAIMSEVFHRNGVPTERVLCIIGYDDSTAVVVRAGLNLIRPAHLFRYLKQKNYEGLKAATDCYIARQVENGFATAHKQARARYAELLKTVAHNFARNSALYESEYIFCWMDWDGDNILTHDAAIIDYGSIRQFGLYHKNYRYDDDARWSTSIPEQKLKARHTVQTFAQLVDYLNTGHKKQLKRFNSHPILKYFDRCYQEYKIKYFINKTGLNYENQKLALKLMNRSIKSFHKVFSYFEEKQARRGTYWVADGIRSDAVYSMRDVMREMPRHYLMKGQWLTPEEFVAIGKSSYARRNDVRLTPALRKKIKIFQYHYFKIFNTIARTRGIELNQLLLEVTMRSSLVNRHEKMTGDGIINVTSAILRVRKELRFEQVNDVIEDFIQHQSFHDGIKRKLFLDQDLKKTQQKLFRIISDTSDGV